MSTHRTRAGEHPERHRRRALQVTVGVALVAAGSILVFALRPGGEPTAAAAGTPPSVPETRGAAIAPQVAAAWEPAPEQTPDPLDELVTDFDVLDPVDLEDEAETSSGLLGRLVDVERTEVEAKGPGETAGDGVVITVELENLSAEPVPLDGAVVDVYDAEGAPAVINFGDPRSEEFTTTVPAGGTARATYVARLASEGDAITVTVSPEPGAPAVSFTGEM